MATRDHEMSSDDDDDNAEVTAEMPETANETDQQSTLSPWVVAKVRLKVGAGKKNAGKPSKRRAGGGKARKKSLSKAGPDEQKMMLVGGGGGGGGQHQPPASPAPAGSDVVAELPPTSSDANNKSVQQRRGTDDRTDEEKEALRKAINIIHEDELSPTVNGMRHFGISKGVISRAIVRFSSPPEPHPLTVCFHFPGTFLTHKYTLEMLRTTLKPLPDAKVTVIQFVDRNCIHGTKGLDNRWLVTLKSNDAKDYLLYHGLNLFNKKIKLRSYDDVLHDEYTEYLQYEQMQKKLYASKQQLGTAAGVDELNDPEGYCEQLQDDELEDLSGLHLGDAHRGPPSTAVNTPEPTHSAI